MIKVNVGDVVRLKSGGPKMTVKQYPFKTIDGSERPDFAECEWFLENGEYSHGLFNINELDVKIN